MLSIVKGETIALTLSLKANRVPVADMSAWDFKAALFTTTGRHALELTCTPEAVEFVSITGNSTSLTADQYILKVRLTNGSVIRTVSDKFIVLPDENWS